jgi:hypothetical protein
VEKPERDPDAVKASRRHHEADAVEKSALARGKLRSVRVPVEDGEETDDDGRDREGRPGLGEHQNAENECRDRDSGLDSGKSDTHEPERPAESHDHGKGDGKDPDGGRSELRTPEAHGDHREHVIEPGDRMKKPGDESSGFPRLDVSRGDECRSNQPHRVRPSLTGSDNLAEATSFPNEAGWNGTKRAGP